MAINPDDSNSALNSNESFAVGDDSANEKKRKRNLVPYKQQYESVAMAIEALAVEDNYNNVPPLSVTVCETKWFIFSF